MTQEHTYYLSVSSVLLQRFIYASISEKSNKVV